MMIANRLKKNLKKLRSMLKHYDTNAYRIYNKDIPEYPYYIDIYHNIAIVYERGKKFSDPHKLYQLQQQKKQDIQMALKEVLGFDETSIYFKERIKQKGYNQYESSGLLQDKTDIQVREGNAKFIINPIKYLDTGLFLDHRNLRQKIYQMSAEKKVLNLFSYTGSFAIQALLGGANEVINVDLSNSYLNWFIKNAQLNNISPEKYQNIQTDILSWLDKSPSWHQFFDIIILDPPSFSNSKSMTHILDIQKDHEKLIKKSMLFLKSGGVLYFSTNKLKFSLAAPLHQIFKIKEITQWTIPLDFNKSKIHQTFKIQF